MQDQYTGIFPFLSPPHVCRADGSDKLSEPVMFQHLIQSKIDRCQVLRNFCAFIYMHIIWENSSKHAYKYATLEFDWETSIVLWKLDHIHMYNYVIHVYIDEGWSTIIYRFDLDSQSEKRRYRIMGLRI